jgi:acyl-[acyl-carrier-protein]-phospholipid O-acyltransferase/long-chain-fatty-acid--[acyl-carrier-protein] ligase
VSPQDRVIHALPLSDSLGLTAGLLLPLLSGAETRFAAEEPAHGPTFRAAQGPTIIIGSDPFLAAYADSAGPDELRELRTIVADGTALDAETARLWADRPGTSVLIAFSLPEAAGAVAINSLTHNRTGSAGRLLPGMDIRLETVEGMTEGGRLWVSGPNVMAGYLRTEAPGILQPPLGGWHDTDEVVAADREGFLTLHGCAERTKKSRAKAA